MFKNETLFGFTFYPADIQSFMLCLLKKQHSLLQINNHLKFTLQRVKQHRRGNVLAIRKFVLECISVCDLVWSSTAMFLICIC